MKKILWLTNIPSPYRVAFFNELGKYCQLTVLFEKASSDGRDDDWKNYSFDNFNGVVLKSIAVSVNTAISLQFTKYLDYDSIIVVGNPATPTGVLAIFYMQLVRMSYAVESDGAFPVPAKGIKGWLKKLLYMKAKNCFTTSDVGVEYFINYGVKPNTIHKYPFTSIKDDYLLESPLTPEEKLLIRKSLNIQSSNIVLSVGQFIHRKGFDLLLDAANMSSREIDFFIIGNEPTLEYLEYCKKNKLTNVHFVRFMKPSQLRQWYLASDIFVLPTREDIWGLVINEAMACGLPVVTTDRCVSGLEMVKSGVNGYLVPAEDSTAIADAITKILSSKQYHSLCVNALRIAKKYTIERMVLQHIKLFNKLY